MGTQEDNNDRLKALGKNPGEAIKRWSKLDQGERAVVVTYMSMYYDVAFAKLFLAETKQRARPEESIVITNDPQLTPAKLTGGGYRRRNDASGAAVWVHPSGRQIWILGPPKAGLPTTPSGTPGALPPVKPEEHDDVQAARDYVAVVEQELQDSIAAIRRVKSNPNSPTYKQDLLDATMSLNKMVKDAIEADETFDLWADGLNPADQQKIQELKDRLLHLRRDPLPSDVVVDFEELDPDGTLMADYLRRHPFKPDN